MSSELFGPHPGGAHQQPSPFADLTLGQVVTLQYRKFDGSDHWRNAGYIIEVDDHGAWVGCAAGTRVSRPGRTMLWTAPWVTLCSNEWFTLNINDTRRPEVPTRFYADVTLPPTLERDGGGISIVAVDMDLDLVVTRDETRSYIDDEDEFAAHDEKYGYPDAVREGVRRSARNLLSAYRAGHELFTVTAPQMLERWLDDDRSGTQPPEAPGTE